MGLHAPVEREYYHISSRQPPLLVPPWTYIIPWRAMAAWSTRPVGPFNWGRTCQVLVVMSYSWMEFIYLGSPSVVNPPKYRILLYIHFQFYLSSTTTAEWPSIGRGRAPRGVVSSHSIDSRFNYFSSFEFLFTEIWPPYQYIYWLYMLHVCP